MCNLFLALAVSFHLSYNSFDKMNYIHPNSNVECNNVTAGLFYNSEYRLSPYVGYNIGIAKNQKLNLGLVGGYHSFPVLPMVRYVNRIFFLAPAIVLDTTEYYFEQYLIDFEQKQYPALIIGIEIKKKII